MLNGIISIYKEAGYTSHDVVAKMRGICRQKKIGHTGTLDPQATGVLPVCLGSGTKLCDMLTEKEKEYKAVMLLGVTTDTQDTTGQVLSEKTVTVTEEQVKHACRSFLGKYQQVPPMYSALKVNGKKLYLSPIMDLYNGEIISYNLATRPQPSMVQTMLTDALKQLSKDEHPILHSDQGWQYQMSRWQRWLKDSGIVQSMSRRGNCLDKAVIESFFGTLKSECYYLNEYKNVEDLKRDIIDYINYYNQLRIKEKLGGLSPVQYRLSQAA